MCVLRTLYFYLAATHFSFGEILLRQYCEYSRSGDGSCEVPKESR